MQFATLSRGAGLGLANAMGISMALTAATASRIAKLLNDTGYDVAAGLSEATLNDFLNAHWKSENASASSLYKGDGVAAEVGLSWHYEVRSAAVIDLMPISAAAFARVYKSYLATVPELARHMPPLRQGVMEANELGQLGDNPPPNVQLQIKNLFVQLTPNGGKPVNFEYALTVTGIIQTEIVNGANILRILPISAKVTDPAALRGKIGSLFQTQAQMGPDCVALEKLVLYILNVVLANRIGSFVRQFELPVPIRVVNGVKITRVDLQVLADQLVMMGYLGRQAGRPAAQELFDLQHADATATRQIAHALDSRVQAQAPQAEVLTVSNAMTALASQWPARGIFVILHQRLFQAIAATLHTQVSHQSGGSVIGIHYSLDYEFDAGNATAIVTDTGLDVSADIHAHAGARAWISTHCGDVSAGVSADTAGHPKFDARFSFEGRDVVLTTTPERFTLNWNFGGLPFPLNKILGYILDILSDALIAVLALIGLSWKTKLTSLPDTFPGTDLKYDLKLDRRVIKDTSQPALLILGEVDFLP